jgi:NAD(P)H-dependent flavin oxidoreductase YrpB (nitropropane dioxygenase family)
MSWTEADGDALFRQPLVESTGDDTRSLPDDSGEAMRRLRFPFEANQAHAAQQGQDLPQKNDERV